jgi:hydroxymethylpyrimidine pyrophosphatase-like HAD family hydrolase/GTPase SAR1 family protein
MPMARRLRSRRAVRYFAVACDFDGTLAAHGRVAAPVIAALERCRTSGRRLLLVTGRQAGDLVSIFPHVELFEWVVAENGAVLYRPASRELRILGEPPPGVFLRALEGRGVSPLSAGAVIVATWEPHETAVLETIHELGLELQVIFNKGAVMVLPSGINKATGLAAALVDLGLSPHNVVGVGDAENDHALITFCECSAAVANALPLVKQHADLVTEGEDGAGVIELIDRLIATDLKELEPRLTRHHLLIGLRQREPVTLKPYASRLLLAGPSGSGKTTLATGLLERLAERRYQFCVLDPEGDYESFEPAVTLGTRGRPPQSEEVLQVLKHPRENAVVNLLGMPLAERPRFFSKLSAQLQEFHARTGRPHWFIADEAHHLVPASWQLTPHVIPWAVGGLLYITVKPSTLAQPVLSSAGTVIATSESPAATLLEFAAAVGQNPPQLEEMVLEPDEALVWTRESPEPPFRMRLLPVRTPRRRHRRKYAEGELGPDQSFYFRGPDGKLNLRAQNLVLFLQLAEGIDDTTWMHHLWRGDYSRWFRASIKDDGLAAEVERIESLPLSPRESRALVRKAVEQHYTLPVAPGGFPAGHRGKA